jgi:hypothetical protein
MGQDDESRSDRLRETARSSLSSALLGKMTSLSYFSFGCTTANKCAQMNVLFQTRFGSLDNFGTADISQKLGKFLICIFFDKSSTPSFFSVNSNHEASK